MTGLLVKAHVLAPGAPGGLRLVFAHGLEDGWASWVPLAAQLDPTWQLIALDLPWRAGNDYRWRREASPAAWLRAGLTGLAELTEPGGALDGPVDVVVAHSFGANALLDLHCAPGGPPLAAPSVLICPLYRPPGTPVTWRMLDRSRRAFETHVRHGVLARLGSRAGTLDPDVLETMMAKTLDRIGPIGLLTVFEQFVSSAELPLSHVDPPTMVLAGGADPTLSPASAATLARLLRRGELRVHDDFDHFCHIRAPAAVAAHLDPFIRSARPAAHASIHAARPAALQGSPGGAR